MVDSVSLLFSLITMCSQFTINIRPCVRQSVCLLLLSCWNNVYLTFSKFY